MTGDDGGGDDDATRRMMVMMIMLMIMVHGQTSYMLYCWRAGAEAASVCSLSPYIADEKLWPRLAVVRDVDDVEKEWVGDRGDVESTVAAKLCVSEGRDSVSDTYAAAAPVDATGGGWAPPRADTDDEVRPR